MGPARATAATAAALLIGSELLAGKVAEQNLTPLARTLRALGIRLCHAAVVADDRHVISDRVRDLSQSHDVLFTSGGVGPTHDDVTLAAVADAFSVETIFDPRLCELLRGVYGSACTEDHLLMARVPEGSRLCSSPDVRWPTVVMRNVWIMPGVPELFRMKLAIVRDHLVGSQPLVSCEVRTRLEETALKPLLDRVVAGHPDVEIGSYPKWFDERYKTKVTFDGADESQVRRASGDFIESLPRGTRVGE